MSAKGNWFEVWVANGRFRFAIDVYRDANETKVFGIWVPFGFRSLDSGGFHKNWKKRRCLGRYSVDLWRLCIKFEDYGRN